MKWNSILIVLLLNACNTGAQKSDPAMDISKIIKSDHAMDTSRNNKSDAARDTNKIVKSDEEWRSVLTPSQYAVCRLKGTEPAGSGKYDKFYEKGFYRCVACGTRLFDSGTKYNSGSGWPSFYDIAQKGNVTTQKDTSYGMVRIEVSCAHCGAHLGHVFEDGPEPTGLRYCINSLALEFVPEADSLHTEHK